MSPITARTCNIPPPDADSEASAASPLLVSVSIRDPLILQRCYLPFFKRGGLFVPSTRTYQLRQRLFLILKLPGLPGTSEGESIHAVNATVAWLTPAQAQGGGGTGFGLHFDANPVSEQSEPRLEQSEPNLKQSEPNLKQSIESLLAALL